MFDHEGPAVGSVMRDLTVGVFDNLGITSPMNVYQRVAYMQRIFKGDALKIYTGVLVGCRQSAKELAGDEWNLSKLKGLSADYFWTWEKTDTTGYDVHTYLGSDKCVNFKRYLWFELG